jgi:transcriptional regulator with XRE-family HTH domain
MSMNKLGSMKLPRCPECGGTVQLSVGTGRTREYRRNVKLAVPDDFRIPTCTRCGEEVMIPEVSEELDKLLEGVFLAQQARQLRSCVQVLRERHGVTQQQIEDACCVTRSYLSHLLGKRREASPTLMRLLESFALSPDLFEHALENAPFDRQMVGLFAVAPSRQYRTSSGFRPHGLYRAYRDFGALKDTTRASA